MAHEIEKNDVFGEVRELGQRAWHGLGVEIPNGMSAVPAFKQIGLDWSTRLIDVVAQWKDADGKQRQFKIQTHAAHVRDNDTQVYGLDDLLAVVGEGYKPISNREMAEFTDALVEVDKKVIIETAGSLRNGKVIFALVRLPQDIEVVDKDILQNYVLVRNSHDGSAAFQVYPTAVRVVCANTLRYSERDAGKGTKFQHTGDVKGKIEHARLALGLIGNETKRFEAQVRVLAAKHVTKEEVSQYFRSVYDATFPPVPEGEDEKVQKQIKKRDEMLDHWFKSYDQDERQQIDGIRGTLWAAYNAVSQWHDHERGRFGTVQESNGRVHSNLFGTSHFHKQTAFKRALALA